MDCYICIKNIHKYDASIRCHYCNVTIHYKCFSDWCKMTKASNIKCIHCQENTFIYLAKNNFIKDFFLKLSCKTRFIYRTHFKQSRRNKYITNVYNNF